MPHAYLVTSCIRCYRHTDPQLSRALELLLVSPISWRKSFIQMVQLGRVNRDDLTPLARSRDVFVEQRLLRPDDLYDILQPIVQLHGYRSIFWMFARCLPEPSSNREADEIRRDGFYKEFAASQTVWSYDQLKDYGPLLGVESLRDLKPPWADAARRVAISLANKLNREGIWFPKVQRRKNVSQDTANRYLQFRPRASLHEITTRDLEVLWAEEGIMLGGECELRSAWKFNDTKPRLYYCQGGRDYFASRYMKRFAIILMESIPTCRQELRTHPEYFLSQNFDKDYVVTWDFESFTTTLSELKFFLYYVARSLDDMAVYECRLFDYRLGIVTATPSELLLSYNDVVNIQSPFSIHRIIDKFFYDMDSSISYRQQNSGMLGVAGNIGFSTALHGYAIMEIVGPDKGVCVGDDAKAVDPLEPNDQLIPEISQLGNIHPEKFSISLPGDEDPYRFLKRAFYRNPDGSFYRDVLLNIPLAPWIDGYYSHRDVHIDLHDPLVFVKKLVAQTSSLLWEMMAAYDLTTKDRSVVKRFLILAYKRLGLPTRGMLPGALFKPVGSTVFHTVQFAIPPIEGFDPVLVDWLEHLLEHCDVQPSYSIPILAQYRRVDKPSVGETIFATKEKMWAAFEDLGMVKLENVFETRSFLDKEGKSAIRKFIKKSMRLPGENQLLRVQAVKPIPDVFDELFAVPLRVYAENIAGIL